MSAKRTPSLGSAARDRNGTVIDPYVGTRAIRRRAAGSVRGITVDSIQ
jgi:hypothetical protein